VIILKAFGINVGDLAAITTVIGFGFGVITLLFKQIVVNPLTNSIDSLTEELNASKKDRKALRDDINSLSIKVVKVEGKTDALDEKIDTHINTSRD